MTALDAELLLAPPPLPPRSSLGLLDRERLFDIIVAATGRARPALNSAHGRPTKEVTSTPALTKVHYNGSAVLAAHGSVEHVPVESGMDADALSFARAQLCLCMTRHDGMTA